MKKVLSLVLVCMMMASLFVMNASASVATYEGFENETYEENGLTYQFINYVNTKI